MGTRPQRDASSREEITRKEEPQSIEASQEATPAAIWDVIAGIGQQISAEEWAKVPSDASINYRSYLYGASKKNR